MPKRKVSLSSTLAGEAEPVPIAVALRRSLARGYTRETFRADLMAGVVVGFVALPLSMALGTAAGAASLLEPAVAPTTLAIPVTRPKIIKRVPAPLIAISLVSIAVAVAVRAVPDLHVATIGSRFKTVIGDRTFTGIPPLPPLPM